MHANPPFPGSRCRLNRKKVSNAVLAVRFDSDYDEEQIATTQRKVMSRHYGTIRTYRCTATGGVT
jgi:hypothetical protein